MIGHHRIPFPYATSGGWSSRQVGTKALRCSGNKHRGGGKGMAAGCFVADREQQSRTGRGEQGIREKD